MDDIEETIIDERYQNLINVLISERDEFLESIKNLPFNEILDYSFRYHKYNDIIMLLEENIKPLSKEQIDFLLQEEKPLFEMYQWDLKQNDRSMEDLENNIMYRLKEATKFDKRKFIETVNSSSFHKSVNYKELIEQATNSVAENVQSINDNYILIDNEKECDMER